MIIWLPDGPESYKRTPAFIEASLPVGLLKDHSTKGGTWGLIHVEEGVCATSLPRCFQTLHVELLGFGWVAVAMRFAKARQKFVLTGSTR